MVLISKNEERIEQLARCFKTNYCSFVNYELFWESLAPISNGGGVAPSSDSELGKAIDKSFGSFDEFVKLF